MNQIALFLQSCANNNRLNVFLALAFLGPLPVSVNEIADFTDIKRHTVSECLDKLRAIGLALCKGAIKRTDWQLSAAGWVMAHMLFSVIGANTPRQLGQPQALPMVLNLPSDTPSDGIKSTIGKDAMALNLPSPSGMALNLPSAVVESESVNNINSNSTDLLAPEILRSQFATILKAGGVYANAAKSLLRKLETAPDFLPHLLAHLAYVKSGRAKDEQGYKFGGVYIRDCVDSLARVTDAELPPTDLDFDSALRWAMNGGLTDEQITNRQAEEATRAAEQDAYEKRLAALQATQEQTAPDVITEPPSESVVLWQAVLGQLQMEMPRSTFDTWVRDMRLLSEDAADGRVTYTIGAPNAYAKDWLENRLTSSIKRAISTTMGRANLDVRFVVLEREKEK